MYVCITIIVVYIVIICVCEKDKRCLNFPTSKSNNK